MTRLCRHLSDKPVIRPHGLLQHTRDPFEPENWRGVVHAARGAHWWRTLTDGGFRRYLESITIPIRPSCLFHYCGSRTAK
jgi:hypothetical protein